MSGTPRQRAVLLAATACVLAGVLAIATHRDVDDDAAWRHDLAGDDRRPAPIPSSPEQVERSALPVAARQREADASTVGAEAEAGGRCVVEVVDAFGRAVAAATVVLLDANTTDTLSTGTTDAAGEWHAVVPVTTMPLSMVAAAEGLADRRIDVPRQCPDRLRIELGPASVLEGLVSLADGRPAPRGTRVVAWPTMTPPPPSAFRDDASRGVSVLLSADVGDDGRFVIYRVSASSTYTIAAGGDGWTCVEPVRDVTVESGPIHVELWRLYGCLVRAALADARPVPPSVLGTWSTQPADEAAARVVDVPSVESCLGGLLGIEDVMHAYPRDWRRHVVVVAAPHTTASLGGVTVSYRIPGFEPTEAAIDLPPIDGQRVAERTVLLRQTASGIGSLSIRLTGRAAPPGFDGGGGRAQLVLELVPTHGPEPAFRIPLIDVSLGSTTIDGIPYGTYRARLSAILGGSHPRDDRLGTLLVMDAAQRTLSVPMDDLGSVVFLPRRHDTNRRSAAITLHARRVADGRRADFHLFRAPYLLYALLPGEYEFELKAASRAGGEERTTAFAEVRAGQTTAAEFDWPVASEAATGQQRRGR